jgi:transposase
VLGASVAPIARDADVSPSSIYRWRRKLRSKLAQPTGFAAVAVHADPPKIDYGSSDMLVMSSAV